MEGHNDKMPNNIFNNSNQTCPEPVTFYICTVMIHPKSLSITDFTYTLPEEKIAQEPLVQRDTSRLLIYKQGKTEETVFNAITRHLPEKSMLVFNDTKVIHARIFFENEHGATIEVFLLEPVAPVRDLQLAMFQHHECTWRCLVGHVKKWREPVLTKYVRIGDSEVRMQVRLKGKVENDFLVQISWSPENYSLATILAAAGQVPLPPYIRRRASDSDEYRYQTLFACQDGSVAAPTAGLHFSEQLMEDLKSKSMQRLFVTLHVSAGTFKPVKVDRMQDHHMHAEQFVVQKETIEKLLNRGSEPVVAVGTTSCRTLESLFWLGKTIAQGHEHLTVHQWEPYELLPDAGSNMEALTFTAGQALEAILDFMKKRKLNQITGSTSLLIAPGYQFKIVSGIITNFHLPNSTLLLLVAAFIGNDWRKVYDYALSHDFRFLSYGDANLIWRTQSNG